MFVVGQKHLARRCLRSIVLFFRPFFCFGICKRMLWIWNLFIWINKKRPSFPFAANRPLNLSCQICLTGSRTEIWSVKYYLPTPSSGCEHEDYIWSTLTVHELRATFHILSKNHEKPMNNHHPLWQIESKMVDFPWIGMIGQFAGELPRFSWGTQGISAEAAEWWHDVDRKSPTWSQLGGVPLNFSSPGLWGWWPLKEKSLNLHLLWQILFCFVLLVFWITPWEN